MKRLLIILPLICILIGCNTEFTEEHLMEHSDISLIWKGAVQVSFNESTGQLGYNDADHEYRVYNDKLSDWFTIRCSEEPLEVGQELEADIMWTGDKGIKLYNGLPFSVKKINNNGLIWLWNDSEKIGIIIKDIR